MLVFSLLAPQAAVLALDGGVCGYDGITYKSAADAEEVGVDVSYEFACVRPSTEDNLYEDKTEVSFAGMLIEIGSTELPTTLIIRDNKNTHDYTVEIDSETDLNGTALSDWIPGDQVKVRGVKNENTENIEADELENVSISRDNNRGVNGWITKIDKEKKEITYQWANVDHVFTYTDETKFVAAGKNPATVDDLVVGDRIRGRLIEIQCITTPCFPQAKIVVVLRRGDDLFMKIRTFRPNAELVRMDSTVVPTTIQVKILPTPGLKTGDVNNLIGTEGALVTVNITEDTKITRKYFGETGLDSFGLGDQLQIVGRVNDNGTVDAKLLKNNSIWMTNLQGFGGVVTEVNVDKNYLMVNWTPVKQLTKTQLKNKLEMSDNIIEAQVVGNDNGSQVNLLSQVKNKIVKTIKQVKEKAVNEIKLKVQTKKVQIERIKHKNVKLNDLIQRMSEKKMRVDISSDTIIMVGGVEATINEITNGDKVRIRGVRHASLPLISAESVVVVSSLPEIEEDLNESIDDINVTVDEIVTDDDGDQSEDSTSTETEEVVEDGLGENEVDDSVDQNEAEAEDDSVVDDSAEEPADDANEEIVEDENSEADDGATSTQDSVN